MFKWIYCCDVKAYHVYYCSAARAATMKEWWEGKIKSKSAYLYRT